MLMEGLRLKLEWMWWWWWVKDEKTSVQAVDSKNTVRVQQQQQRLLELVIALRREC